MNDKGKFTVMGKDSHIFEPGEAVVYITTLDSDNYSIGEQFALTADDIHDLIIHAHTSSFSGIRIGFGTFKFRLKRWIKEHRVNSCAFCERESRNHDAR